LKTTIKSNFFGGFEQKIYNSKNKVIAIKKYDSSNHKITNYSNKEKALMAFELLGKLCDRKELKPELEINIINKLHSFGLSDKEILNYALAKKTINSNRKILTSTKITTRNSKLINELKTSIGKSQEERGIQSSHGNDSYNCKTLFDIIKEYRTKEYEIYNYLSITLTEEMKDEISKYFDILAKKIYENDENVANAFEFLNEPKNSGETRYGYTKYSGLINVFSKDENGGYKKSIYTPDEKLVAIVKYHPNGEVKKEYEQYTDSERNNFVRYYIEQLVDRKSKPKNDDSKEENDASFIKKLLAFALTEKDIIDAVIERTEIIHQTVYEKNDLALRVKKQK
jgi:hypothetical protein